ncbi:hypothetical protein LTR36_001336 [Oleoguttula mirabilis]|uniref:Beta-xylosidase C-terminal Concanavalin A-like domain-containing protein n=1 Tax=Oleoguttula mirabilis TaxID=1507867 RepID=A0AAV9JNZ4_9PEZI|nr:hypothetical protein LTR36_001336 [Oleoguttula mirabilis]
MESQLSQAGTATPVACGFFAPKLHHRNGTFHLTCVYLGASTYTGILGTVFTTANIFDDAAWSDALVFSGSSIDPDVFWSDNGTVYLTSAGIIQQTIDLSTGNVTEPYSIWNGTGLPSPEGPHIYKKDGWYYLLIAEGVRDVFRDVPGIGPFVQDPDVIDFTPGSSIAPHFLFWRYPENNTFIVSPEGHPDALQIRPAPANLTGIPQSNETSISGHLGLPLIARRQTHTLFSFSVDLSFSPRQSDQEAGISVFLTQLNHIDLGIARSAAANLSGNGSESSLEFRLRTETTRTVNSTIPASTQVTPLPVSWSQSGAIRLQIHTANDTHYAFSAFPANNANAKIILGYFSAIVVSGGSGEFTGALLGAYATCNGAGASGQTRCPSGGDAYFSRWRYTGVAQEVDFDQYVPFGVL